MTRRPQSEAHPDANQLTAFAEGSLSASERALCLQHLAECADCREIAFLASASLPSEAPSSAPSRRFSWSTRWPALSVGAAALAAAIITAVILHHPHQTTPQKAVQIASESSPVASPAPTTATSMNNVTEAEPRPHNAHKPSPSQKAVPKPEAQVQESLQDKDAAALEVTGRTPSASALPQQTAPQQLAAEGKQLKAYGAMLTETANAPAAPVGLPQQAAIGGAAKSSPSDTLRSRNEAYLRSPDGLSQISGTIADTSGATIPHAKIILSLTSSTDHRETFTGADGRFIINSLQPGKYHLEISSPGFTTQVHEVDLGTSQLVRVDSKLALGSAAETVAVEAAGPELKTESVSVQAGLSDKKPPQTSVTNGTRTLALDTNGQLLLNKKAGKHWKAVHGPWKKSVLTSLSLAPDNQFKVSTSQDSWLSSDGEHWRPAH